MEQVEFLVEMDKDQFDQESLQECANLVENDEYYWANASVESYRGYLDKMHAPDEICITENRIQFEISYPLHNPVIFTITADAEGGFTRRELFTKACERYHVVYFIENMETYGGGDPGTHPRLPFNRAESHGVFGIWGHYIGDLIVHSIYKPEGETVWKLSTSS